ncbi:hypothetical protein ACWESM_15605 [Nocardia sp. NPDC003999]
MPREYVDAFLGFFVAGRLDEATLCPTVEQVTGRLPRNFEQWSNAHAEAFAPHRAASGDPGA